MAFTNCSKIQTPMHMVSVRFLPDSAPARRFLLVPILALAGYGDDSEAVSNYNGAGDFFQHRFSRWTQGLFQTNYTYGHAFDEVSNGGLFSFTFGSSLSRAGPEQSARQLRPGGV